MKKFFGIVLTVCMLLSMTACGEKNVNSEDGGNSEAKVSVEERADTTATVVKNEEASEEASDDEHEYPYVTRSMGLPAVVEVYKHSEDLSDWGTYGFILTDNEKIFIKFPTLIPTSGDFVAYQNDGTVVASRTIDDFSIQPEAGDFEKLVDLAVYNTEEMGSLYMQMFMYLGPAYVTDMNLELNKKEEVTIGQFECCKGEGALTYSSRQFDGSKTLNFVIYGAFTENGSPFYWAVFDESEDQSLGDIVAQDAERMGYTIAVDAK